MCFYAGTTSQCNLYASLFWVNIFIGHATLSSYYIFMQVFSECEVDTLANRTSTATTWTPIANCTANTTDLVGRDWTGPKSRQVSGDPAWMGSNQQAAEKSSRLGWEKSEKGKLRLSASVSMRYSGYLVAQNVSNLCRRWRSR